MSTRSSTFRKRFLIFLVILFACGAITAYFLGISIPGISQTKAEQQVADKPARLKVELVKDLPHTVRIPEDVRASLGIRKNGKDLFAKAAEPKGNRPIVLSGSTSFDPASVYRIRARFAPAEVIRIERYPIPIYSESGTTYRELRPGDEVRAGQPLGVFYSVEVGTKKNDLIDAIVQMKLDKEILDKAEASFAIPQVMLLTFQRNVQTDINAIQKALNYLETWGIPEEEIKAVMDEADEIVKNNGKRDYSSKFKKIIDLKFDPKQTSKKDEKKTDKKGAEVANDDETALNKWGKVVLKSPVDGFIVERNVAKKELLQDPTTSLFQIARADKILVRANSPEEEVSDLYKEWKKSGLKWTIRTLGDSEGNGVTGQVDEISLLVDPNQHTIPVSGIIDNKDRLLRAGQYVTATIELPPPDNVVEISASAIVDDGKQTIVFVQADEKKPEYTLRRVMVTQRYENKVFVRNWLSEKEKKLTPEEEDAGMLPRQPLQLGERVLTSGLLELKKELEDLEAEKAE